MRAVGAALVLSTSAIAVGLGVAVEAAALTLIYMQGGISADTPINGLTLGLVIGGGLMGLAAAARAVKYLIAFGGDLERWRTGLNKASDAFDILEQVQKNAQANTEEIAALQRWRAEVEPIFTEWKRRNSVG